MKRGGYLKRKTRLKSGKGLQRTEFRRVVTPERVLDPSAPVELDHATRRSTPLRAAAIPRLGVGEGPVATTAARKAPSRHVIPAKVRKAVTARAGGVCEASGRYGPDLHQHHRKLAGQGGEDSLENLIAVLPIVHHIIHDVMSRELAESLGLLVSAYADPADHPVSPDAPRVLAEYLRRVA